MNQLSACEFKKLINGDPIAHKYGDTYVIALTPDDGLRLESTAAPAYGYHPENENRPLWVRDAIETEDGRFEIVG